ncbi:MAG: pilus assembly protein TadG-related protein [Methylobacter sp.]|uniref:pilus assembly protein TadG-related protein n=1 Tax=Methylobacter sp. TaxID=2051955 RepID=UPI00258AA6A4|nr:pilus assembly protein TadG-related protein [Methylobacter sp.]MCL7421809.1 pilus assembly protein TadG-related protein [Methylobacter sp.]
MRITKGAGMTVENNPLRAGRQARGGPSIKSPACQRGALGILGAVTLLLSVLFTALAVDTGRLMLEQRRLQSVADMAALDASSQSGSCGDGTLPTAVAAAVASAARNNHPVGGTRTLVVALGNTSTGADGVRVFAAGDPETAMSVEVIAGNTVPASLFAGGMLGEQAALQARAVAKRQALAGFSAGSGLVSLNSEDSALLNSLLGGVLGSNVGLDLVSYQGIAATDVKLADLVEAAAGVGTVDELLGSELTLGELLQIYADAVNAKEVVNADVIAAMQTLINANVSDLSVTLGEILAVATDNPDEAASASVYLLDLITTTALVANGANALTLSPELNLLGLEVDTILKVIEPPQIAIGPPGKDEEGEWRTQIKTAQVSLDAAVHGGPSILLDVEVDLALKVEVAQGRAWLKSIQCRNQGNSGSIVTIGAQPGIASIALTQATNPSASAAAISVKLLGIHVADVEVGLNLPLESPGETDLEYLVNADNPLPQLQTASSSAGGSLGNGLGGLVNSLELRVIPLSLSLVDRLILGPLLDVLLGDLVGSLLDQLLSPLLTQLSVTILDPLLRLLGIEVGKLDVQLFKLDVDSHRPTLLV